MLIEFSASNFRSIKDRQTISMVPGSSQVARTRFSYSTDNKQIPYCLKYVGMFGANNSGKSNVVKAFAEFRRMVVKSFSDNPSSAASVSPYRLDPAWADEPTELEAVFLHGETLFQYGFAIHGAAILSEWLFATPPGGRLQRWIDRETNPETGREKIYINPALAGERKVWIESTRPDALVLSTAQGLNAKSLAGPYDWIKDHVGVINEPNEFSNRYTAQLCNSSNKMRVINVMRGCGIDLIDIVVREETIDFSSILNEEFLKSTPEFSKPRLNVSFLYAACDGTKVEISLNDESDGTKLLFALVGPLLDVRDKGMLLVTDEIHRSLHPLAFRYLLEEFFLGADKKGHGQLLFATHETYTLGDQLMHPDQVVLVSKEGCEGTKLTAVSDFKVRASESIRTGYLAGRYGGLPVRRLPLASPAELTVADGQ